MRRQRPDFKKSNEANDSFYDLREDWDLIEASMAKQYGIRIRGNTDMPWTEFCTLIGGLMPDTPLGQIVTIRAEKDPKVIKEFNSSQRKIHSQWRKRQAEKKLDNPEQLDKDIEALGRMLSAMFSKKEVKQ